MQKAPKVFLVVLGCVAALVAGVFIGMDMERNASNVAAVNEADEKIEAASKAEQANSAEPSEPYVGSVQDADVLIRMPDLRQYSTYTCGATCVQMVMNWALPQKGDINLADLESELGTTDEGGTTPQSILNFLDGHGVDATLKQDMTAEDLVGALDQGHPVIIAQQAWSTAEDGSYNTTNPDDAETYLIEGHYVVCTGYKQVGQSYNFYFNDPACVGICTMTWDELDGRWVDVDANGNTYNHTGIEVEMETNYNPEGVYHLD